MDLLRGSSSTVETGEELSERERAALAKMDLKEAEQRRAELARLKHLQARQEQKLKRQNKIKSKKYRKLVRKQKEKDMQKEIEELQRTDPEAAYEKLMEAKKTRVLERATLRHRNNSKYLQLLAKKAKGSNDKEVS